MITRDCISTKKLLFLYLCDLNLNVLFVKAQTNLPMFLGGLHLLFFVKFVNLCSA